MNDLYLIVGLILLTLAVSELRIWLAERQSREREKNLFALVRSLQNRLHAKDLSGYMALEDEDRRRQDPNPKTFVAGNDTLEAQAEELSYRG